MLIPVHHFGAKIDEYDRCIEYSLMNAFVNENRLCWLTGWF